MELTHRWTILCVIYPRSQNVIGFTGPMFFFFFSSIILGTFSVGLTYFLLLILCNCDSTSSTTLIDCL